MFIVFWPSQSVDEDGIWDEVPINDDGRDTWPQWTVHWRPRVAESVADFGPKEVLCSTWIDILPQKLLNRLNTPNRTPETSWEDTWIQKRMLFLDVFCLPNASRNPQVVAAFIRVLKNSDASPRLRTTCLDPGRRRNSSRWASMGTSVASGDAPWLAEYEHHIFQRGRSTTNQKRVTSVVIVWQYFVWC